MKVLKDCFYVRHHDYKLLLFLSTVSFSQIFFCSAFFTSHLFASSWTMRGSFIILDTWILTAFNFQQRYMFFSSNLCSFIYSQFIYNILGIFWIFLRCRRWRKKAVGSEAKRCYQKKERRRNGRRKNGRVVGKEKNGVEEISFIFHRKEKNNRGNEVLRYSRISGFF